MLDGQGVSLMQEFSRILPFSWKSPKNSNQLFPSDRHILGDSAYPLKDWLLTPYRDNGHLTLTERQYNFIHSSTRMVIERAFGILKGRFRRLNFIEMDSLEDTAKIVNVACTLHNICLMKDDEFEESFELEEEVNNFQDIGSRDTNAAMKRDTIRDNLV